MSKTSMELMKEFVDSNVKDSDVVLNIYKKVKKVRKYLGNTILIAEKA